MLRHRGLRERELVDDEAARACLLPREHPQDTHADRMADGFRERCEFLVRLVLPSADHDVDRLVVGRTTVWVADLSFIVYRR